MNMFRTQVKIPDINPKIDYDSKVMFLGSCFSDNIGNKLKYNKFNTSINPFGVVYNPISVINSLDLLIENKTFKSDDLSFGNEKWFSFLHHSIFSDTDKNTCLKNINYSLCKSAEYLRQCDYVFITFGTAWVYKHLETDSIVSNCHKLPSNKFNRYRLSVDTIVDAYSDVICKLQIINPKIKIIFTVSPIRHWKDGAHENQLSKSTLLLAVNTLTEKYKHTNYFPSYEIIMDELRDYRFYADDMIHIGNVAIDFIWNKFKESLCSDKTICSMKTISKIVLACNHRPFNIKTDEHQAFLKKTIFKINQLKLANKDALFHNELINMRSQLLDG